MRKTIASLALITGLLVACSTGPNQNSALPEVPPESTGISAECLANIDSMCIKAVDEGEVPGMVALLARQGKIIYHKAFGMSDNTNGRAMQRDDIFRIASQSKAITATAVMMLWEEGKFSLDDPISRFIPEFMDPQVLETFHPEDTSYTTVPAKASITIRHLLTHTSGIGYGMIDDDDRFRMIYQKAGIVDLYTTEEVYLADNINKLAVLPLHQDPGERFTYSEGQDVLGYLVELISGMSLDKFLRTRIFDPLGMEDTWFYLPEQLQDRLVTVQTRVNGEWVPFPETFYDPDYPVKGAGTFFSGGAGLCSTARDYALFLQMYLNGGELNGTRIIKESTIDTIMSNHFPGVWKDTDVYYGLAFEVLTEKGGLQDGRLSAGTFSWGGYFNTQYAADPQEQVICILMKQTENIKYDPTWQMFIESVKQCIFE